MEIFEIKIQIYMQILQIVCLRFQDFQRSRDFERFEILKDFKNNLFQHFKSHVTAKITINVRNFSKQRFLKDLQL